MRNLGITVVCLVACFASEALAGMTTASYNLAVSNQLGEQLMGTVNVRANSSDGSITFTVELEHPRVATLEAATKRIGEFAFNVDRNAVTAPAGEWAVTTPRAVRARTGRKLGANSPFGEFALGQIRSSGSNGSLVFTIWLPEAYRNEAVARNFTAANADGFVFGAQLVDATGNLRSGDHWVGARSGDLRAVPIPGTGRCAVDRDRSGPSPAVARRVIG